MGQADRWFRNASGLGTSASVFGDSDRSSRSSFALPSQFKLGQQSGEAIAHIRVRPKQSKGKDKKAPKVSLGVLSPVVAGDNSYEFSVIYTDDKAIKASSLGKGDILVGRSNQVAELVSKSSRNKGRTYKVVYRVTAPAGTWDAADNGSYEITLKDKQVSDTSRNYIRGRTLGVFAVSISAPVSTGDTIAPTANLESSAYFTNKYTTFDFFVTYSDDQAIDAESLGDGDISITGPNGFSQLAKKVSTDTPSSGTPRKVRYRFTAPGGTWDTADNGSYTINLQAGQVKDSSGNFTAAQNIGFFPLTLSSVPTSETITPTASLNAANITAGGSTYDFTVTYTDNVAIDADSIDDNDITVVDRNGSIQPVERISVSGNGSSYIATYQIQAPGGKWNRADNGAYDVVVQPNQVKDINGNSVAASTVGGFLADVPLRSNVPSGSGNSVLATDFILDIDTSIGRVNQFEYSRSVPPLPEQVKVKFIPTNLKYIKNLQDFLLIKDSQGELLSERGYILSLRAEDTFKNSNGIFYAEIGESTQLQNGVLIFGIQTKLDLQDSPFSLLDIALNGEDASTQLSGAIFGDGSVSFLIQGLG